MPSILLVNPPIYDFSAYDFWLKPFGLLRVAGHLRGRAEVRLFDYLDRRHPGVAEDRKLRRDRWGRGEFPAVEVEKPAALADIPRRYRRFGRPRAAFRDHLTAGEPPDVALIQTVMTYWYPGVREAIEDIRELCPHTRIVLGGVYATLCPTHARSLGADLVVEGADLDPLWRELRLPPAPEELPLWEVYDHLEVGVLKLARGCPFRCTYCSVPQVEPHFEGHPVERSLAELELLHRLGARHVAFYDDALLFRTDSILEPFLAGVRERQLDVNFHTPNALNARFITEDIAAQMVAAGFRTFHLGFESSAYKWQRRTGGKVYSHELERAVDHLIRAGASSELITAYLIIAHPHADSQEVEASMEFARDLGVRVMLAEFSPLPGTPDGAACARWVDMDEPLNHNKTAFPLRFLGQDRVTQLKDKCRRLNDALRIAMADNTEARPDGVQARA